MDKPQSQRSRRRLRLRVATRLAEDNECAPKRLLTHSSVEKVTDPVTSGGSQGQIENQLSVSSESEGGDLVENATVSSDDLFLTGEETQEPQDTESDVPSGEEYDDFDEKSAEESNGVCSSEESCGMDSQLSDNDSVSFLDSGSISSDNLAVSASSEQEITCMPLDVGPSLFPDSRISASHFNVAFMSIGQRHKLTYSCQTDILQFLTMILPSPSNVPPSSLALTRKFANLKDDVIIQHFCGCCMVLLEPGSSCSRMPCSQMKEHNSVFVRIPLKNQITERFQDPEFVDLIQYRFHREKRPGILGDIYDGSAYMKHANFFESKFNISFALNFDGAPRFKSSAVQIWPVQLYINELPPTIRGSREHMLLAGIWCSPKKPPVSECLSPIIEELDDLATNGVTVIIDGGGREVICKARLLFALADLPAKAMLYNMTQFNGRFGCPTCKHEGEQVSIGRGTARVYRCLPTIMRTGVEHLQHALEAESTRDAVFGVKGRSVLHTLTDFDVIDSNPVDYMHCVLLGIVRMLISLWFDSKYHREPWYIGNKVAQADKRLLAVKPPDCIGRIPRCFRGRAWKATECRTFLLYYLPILHGILADRFLAHALLLSKAIRILLSDNLSLINISCAEELIDLFWKSTETYYGLKFCKMNVHLLSHLPHYVKLFGPLWTHSAFVFEDCIGHLVQMSHGTHDIANQIVTSFLLQWRLHALRKQITGPVELTSYLKSLRTGLRSSERKLTEFISVIGVARNILLDEDETIVRQLLEKDDILTIPCSVVTLLPKIKVRGQVIFSKHLKRVKKRNSFTVAYTDPETPTQTFYGLVERFLTCPADSPNSTHVAIITQLRVESCNELLKITYPTDIQDIAPLLCTDFLSIVGESNDRVAIPIEHILFKCFNISTHGLCALTTLVNECEVCK